jgi:hypothetical protein
MKIISTIGYVVGLTMAAVDVECMRRNQLPVNIHDGLPFSASASDVSVQVFIP